MKEIIKKYKKLDEIEHILLRPGMYIGSTKPHDSVEWILTDKYTKTPICYNPGFLKLFDEIISNSIDESKRNHNLDTIWVNLNTETGIISVKDNGGIPVILHDEGVYIPELIFSSLRAGSNFNDEEDRIVAGTNGVGASLTNIFSKRFELTTGDGKKQFNQIYSNNMSERTAPIIKASDKNFTEIAYIPDYARFGLAGLDDNHILMIKKRVFDIAACNSKIKIYFNNEKVNFKSFRDYASLFTDTIFYDSNENWEICVAPSVGGNQVISFVNSIETKDGGTHVNYIQNQIVECLREMLLKKHKVDIKPSDIKNHLMIFINCNIVNSSFSSQTKEKLITEPKAFGSQFEITQKFAKTIFQSEILQSILDRVDKKQLAEERAELRKLNKNLNTAKIQKLIDAQSKDRTQCTLAITEGDSALGGFRVHRNPQLQGAYPLRGKFTNVAEIKNTDLIKNEEVVNLMGAIGLRFGEAPENLRYNKIYIYTDADPDGTSINCLLINFFYKYWPELFERGIMYRVVTPLLVAQKGKEKKLFYNAEEFNAWEKKTKDNQKWDIEYKKGLAALLPDEFKEIITNPILIKLTTDEKSKECLRSWFGEDTLTRKEKLLK